LIPGGDAELRELTQLFLDLCLSTMPEINDAMAKGDVRTVHRSAHTLRGTAAIFAADDVVSAAWQLEMAARDEQLADAATACETLDREIQRLIPALAEMLQSGARPCEISQ
jgi:HPt (histidine-containing phosphotransfer) domain-containing protein